MPKRGRPRRREPVARTNIVLPADIQSWPDDNAAGELFAVGTSAEKTRVITSIAASPAGGFYPSCVAPKIEARRFLADERGKAALDTLHPGETLRFAWRGHQG